MAAKLLYRDAQGRDAAVNLPESGSFLGRAIDCIIRTDDAMVSRKNCKIAIAGNRWFVEDLGSANGTYVNESRVQRQELNHGDVIRCGSLQVRFVDVAESQPVLRPTAVPQQGMQPQPISPMPEPVAPANKPVQASAKDDDSTRAVDGKAALELMSDKKTKERDKERDDQLAKIVDELKKTAAELEEAVNAGNEAKSERDQAVAKLESNEQEIKRLRGESNQTKEALEKLVRASEKTKEELGAESKVNDQLRAELKQLRKDLDINIKQLEEIKQKSESKDRELATAKDDVKRTRQQAETLNQKLLEMARTRDEQVKAINSKLGDVDNLRDILKERERLIEEQRVGLMNQESQLKDLRKHGDELERELAQARGERDNLRERLNRSQVQVDDLRSELDRVTSLLSGQSDGGEQILSLTKDNAALRENSHALRENLNDANTEIDKLNQQLLKFAADLKEAVNQREKLAQQVKQSDQKLVVAAEQAGAELSAKFETERQQLTAERDEARKQLAATRDQQQGASNAAEQNLGAVREDLSKAQAEREQLKQKIDEIQAQLVAAQQAAQAAQQASPPPAAAQPTLIGSTGGGESQRLLDEMRHVASDAYDGINVAISDLRSSLAAVEQLFAKVERQIPDKDAARKLRDAIDDSMGRSDEAKGHIRSLRSLIE